MKKTSLVPAHEPINWVADVCRTELDRSALHLELDLEPGLLLPHEPAFCEGLRDLVLFACASAPSGCPLTLSAARPAPRLTVVGAASLALRWQVAEFEDVDRARVREGGAESNVIPIRPGIQSAEGLVSSAAAKRLRRAFDSLGWALVFEVLNRGEEIIARLDVDG